MIIRHYSTPEGYFNSGGIFAISDVFLKLHGFKEISDMTYFFSSSAQTLFTASKILCSASHNILQPSGVLFTLVSSFAY